MEPPRVVSRGVRRIVAAVRARANHPPRAAAPAIAVDPGVELPDWAIYSLTWSIPQPTFGGMTTVLLHRARLFAAARRPVDILTFGYDFDLARARRELREEKKLSAGSRLRNLWEEIAAAPDGELERSGDKRARRGGAIEIPGRLDAGPCRKRARGHRIIPSASGDLENGIHQTEYYRGDGSLLLIDARQSGEGGTRKRRELTLFTRDGRPVVQWNRPEDLYEFWLDLVVGQEKAILICDSKFLGGVIHGYQRRRVLKVQCLHSAHLRRESKSPLGLVTQPKKRLLANLEGFDGHVVLTAQQAADLDALFGPSPSRFVVPNSIPTPSLPGVERVEGQAVVVSRLVAAKQIDHAIRAVNAHNDARPHAPVDLEIFGSGEEEQKLRRLSAELGSDSRVAFKGHTNTPEQAYARADFSLNTSQSEGFSLSPLESMAQGCIPISYDVKYGPATIISTGQNGFLVERDNPTALAASISRYMSLSTGDKRRLRQAATARAGEFGDEQLLRRWAKVLTVLVAHHEDLGSAVFRISAVDVRFQDSGFRLEVEGSAHRELKNARACVRAVHRHQPAVARFPCRLTSTRHGSWTARAGIAWGALSWAPEGTFDFALEISDAGDRTTLRVPAPVGYRRQEAGRLALYPTIYSNLSLTIGAVPTD